MPITRERQMVVEVQIAKDPYGRRAVLLQLPDGFVLMPRSSDVRQIAGALIEAADILDEKGSR